MPLFDPHFQVPAAGWTLTFYQSGTTTAITIYSDATLSPTLTNPVTSVAAADASHALFPNIFLSPSSGTFKYVLKNPAGTTILTADSVPMQTDLQTADQQVAGGARITTLAHGTKSSGTFTPDPGDRPVQSYTNGGAHTLAPGSNYGSYRLDITNNASAGAITTSGWTRVIGSFTTTNNDKFMAFANVSEIGSSLMIQALQ
jgi:hypothetical protein